MIWQALTIVGGVVGGLLIKGTADGLYDQIKADQSSKWRRFKFSLVGALRCLPEGVALGSAGSIGGFEATDFLLLGYPLVRLPLVNMSYTFTRKGLRLWYIGSTKFIDRILAKFTRRGGSKWLLMLYACMLSLGAGLLYEFFKLIPW